MADFALAQKQVTKWAKGKTPSSDNPLLVNLFRSVCVCGHCGASMILNSVTTDKAGYYVCSMRRQKRCNESKPIRRDIVEAAIVQGLLYNTEQLLTSSNVEKEELRQLEAERQLAQKKIDDAYELFNDGDLTKEQYRATKHKWTATIDQIDFQIQSQRAVSSAGTSIKTVRALDLTTKEGRMKLQLLSGDVFKAIRVNGNTKTADIEMKAGGFTLYDYPLDRIIDGSAWIEKLALTGDKEHTFTTEAGQPFHVMYEQAPQWVKDAIDTEQRPL